jgi:TAG lipase/lysophosphatidylethanolamine acyltransferase
MLSSLCGVVAEVGSFWQKVCGGLAEAASTNRYTTQKAYGWWTRRKPRDALLDELAAAKSFEEWEDIAFHLDALDGSDLWRQNATSKHYDFRLIYERLQAIIEARDEEDILGLVSLLRSGLVRNLGNITTPKLFNRAYAGTKLLIEDYITQVALAIEYVTALPATQSYESGWTAQAKLDLLHDTRQAFGRSTLVLQGGAIFGLCHLGVVKALHLRGLLPRIITGTATGALVAALVGIHTEDELLDFLNGDGIDLTAFARHSNSTNGKERSDTVSLLSLDQTTLLQTLVRRTKRYFRSGYFLDVNVLEECVRANVGDLTFEEAYARTKRVLNITVATSGRGGIPNLLNYITAPNVLIWSAALASNASSQTLWSPVILKCKDETGAIIPWASAQEITFQSWRRANYSERESPLFRIAELFNVNHFVVSQARPYIAPFLRSDLQHSDSKGIKTPSGLVGPLMRLLMLEIRHRLSQLDEFGLLPSAIRRLLVDETMPGAHMTLVPTIHPSDFLRLLDHPTKQSLEYWILRGERSVWPAVGALKVRCAVEVELDRGYQLVRRRKPLDGDFVGVKRTGSKGSLKNRRRAASVGQSQM